MKELAGDSVILRRMQRSRTSAYLRLLLAATAVKWSQRSLADVATLSI